MRYLSQAAMPTRGPPPNATGHTQPPRPQPPAPNPNQDPITRTFYDHSNVPRIYTDAVIVEALSLEYPDLEITIIPVSQGSGGTCDLLSYARLGFAAVEPITEPPMSPLARRSYYPGIRRGDPAVLAEELLFGKYMYTYAGHEFVMYFVEGSNTPSASYDVNTNQYLVGAPKHVADELFAAATGYSLELHDEIWVFDGGYWDKSRELYASVEKASWDDVILEAEMKTSIQNDVMRFFESRDKYKNLRVPWKRGIIYYGPPGNGKTVSIKATMHTLYQLKDPIPSLYVRSLTSFAGDEYSIQAIFRKARQVAPCLLIFEDLDSLVGDDSRSYFLNEVDGLQNNDGVLMIGSTNHLDRLDPGIAKRPSRFDRKYEFPKPDLEQRIQYCEFWRGKLADNKDVEFPKKLSTAIAKITDKFSFAYIQEAFVASLLAIASSDGNKTALSGGGGGGGSDDLDGLPLWEEIQKQVKILREEI